MTKRTTTVTHPDGTVSKRTSQRHEYHFAAVVQNDNRHEAHLHRVKLAESEERAVAYRQSAETGVITEERTPWVGSETRVVLYVDGHYATAYVKGRDLRPSDEEIRDRLRALAEETAAGWYRNRIATLDAGPEFTYSVHRWSRTADLAEKGRLEIAPTVGGRGRTYVVPVDGEE